MLLKKEGFKLEFVYSPNKALLRNILGEELKLTDENRIFDWLMQTIFEEGVMTNSKFIKSAFDFFSHRLEEKTKRRLIHFLEEKYVRTKGEDDSILHVVSTIDIEQLNAQIKLPVPKKRKRL